MEIGRDEQALAQRVATDVLDTMRAGPRTVGLAAPQIGELVRIVVVDCSTHPRAVDANHGLLVLVDPVIAAADSHTEVAREGCLSLPELTANVRRATRIELRAWTPDGDAIEVEAVGFEARAILHELDHLDGVLILDRVDSLSRDVFRRKSFG